MLRRILLYIFCILPFWNSQIEAQYNLLFLDYIDSGNYRGPYWFERYAWTWDYRKGEWVQVSELDTQGNMPTSSCGPCVYPDRPDEYSPNTRLPRDYEQDPKKFIGVRKADQDCSNIPDCLPYSISCDEIKACYLTGNMPYIFCYDDSVEANVETETGFGGCILMCNRRSTIEAESWQDPDLEGIKTDCFVEIDVRTRGAYQYSENYRGKRNRSNYSPESAFIVPSEADYGWQTGEDIPDDKKEEWVDQFPIGQNRWVELNQVISDRAEAAMIKELGCCQESNCTGKTAVSRWIEDHCYCIEPEINRDHEITKYNNSICDYPSSTNSIQEENNIVCKVITEWECKSDRNCQPFTCQPCCSKIVGIKSQSHLCKYMQNTNPIVKCEECIGGCQYKNTSCIYWLAIAKRLYNRGVYVPRFQARSGDAILWIRE